MVRKAVKANPYIWQVCKGILKIDSQRKKSKWKELQRCYYMI